MASEIATKDTMIEPFTGAVVDTGKLLEVAESLERLRDMRDTLTDAIAFLTSVVVEESKIRGTKTINMGGLTMELSADHEITYDVEALSALHDAGLPPDRWDALVVPTVEYKVDRAVIKQLSAANPAYAEIIENAEQWKPKRQYVKIRK